MNWFQIRTEWEVTHNEYVAALKCENVQAFIRRSTSKTLYLNRSTCTEFRLLRLSQLNSRHNFSWGEAYSQVHFVEIKSVVNLFLETSKAIHSWKRYGMWNQKSNASICPEACSAVILGSQNSRH